MLTHHWSFQKKLGAEVMTNQCIILTVQWRRYLILNTQQYPLDLDRLEPIVRESYFVFCQIRIRIYIISLHVAMYSIYTHCVFANAIILHTYNPRFLLHSKPVGQTIVGCTTFLLVIFLHLIPHNLNPFLISSPLWNISYYYYYDYYGYRDFLSDFSTCLNIKPYQCET